MSRILFLPLACLFLMLIAQAKSTLLEIEQYIPSTIRKPWTVLVLSETEVDFRPILDLETLFIIIANTTFDTNFMLLGSAIVVIPHFETTKNLLATFLIKNNINVNVLLVYSTFSQPTTLKQVRSVSSLDVVLIIETEQGKITYELFQHPRVCRHNLKCKLRGRTLKVGYTSVAPSFDMGNVWNERNAARNSIPPFLLNKTNSVKKHFSGIEAELLHVLVDHYETQFEMVAPPDFQYGNYTSENASFSGKLGMLQRGEVDMIVGLVIGNSDRTMIGKYSPRIFTIKYSIISKRAQDQTDWDAAFKPLPVLGWCILFISISFVAPITFYITKAHRGMVGENIANQSIWRNVAHATATLLVEPWPNPPGGPAAFIICAWFLACVVLQSIYASNFTVQQSFPKEPRRIRTFEDVWNEGRRISVYSGSTMELIMKSNPSPIVQKLRQDQLQTTAVFADQLKLMDAGFVWGTISLLFYYGLYDTLSPDHYNDYYISDIPLLTTFASWLYTEDDLEIPAAINAVILRCSENGLLQKWHSDMTYKFSGRGTIGTLRKNIELALAKKEAALSFSALQGVFVFLWLGLAASTLAFCVELIVDGVRRGKLKRQKKPRNLITVKPYRYLD